MQKTETSTSYAIRNLNDRRFLRLHTEDNAGRDFCGETSNRLVAGTADRDLPRYEAPDLRTALVAMRNDPPWYNSSPERPSHGDVDVSRCAIWAIDRASSYDDADGDPIEAIETARPARVPAILAGGVVETRQPERTPPAIGRAAFGDAWEWIAEGAFALVLLDERLEPGALVTSSVDNLLQIHHVVDLPDGWPICADGTQRFLAAAAWDDVREASA